MLDTGREVDRYVIQSLVGEGGMAEVYRVRHAQLGTWHALKVLTIQSRSVRERLVQEGRLQATLRHVNIAAVTDVLVVDGAPALLMEFIEGPSLERWLASYRPSLDEALAIFAGVLAGVRHAHGKGLIHRDLKPANVLLHVADGAVVPKVADFGLAKGGEDEGRNKTKTGTTMGTPAYMAPEQIIDASKVDQRADVFSLGCILYELVTGVQPFQGDNIVEIFNKVSRGEYLPARHYVPDLPANVVEAIEGALRIDAGHRLADCKAIADLLARDPDGQPLRLPMPTLLPEESPGAEVARSIAAEMTSEWERSAREETQSPKTWMAGSMAGETVPIPAANPPPVDASLEVQKLRRTAFAAVGGAVTVALFAVGVVLAVLVGVLWMAMQRDDAPPAPELAVVAPPAPAPPAPAPEPAEEPAAPVAVERVAAPVPAPVPEPPKAELPKAEPPRVVAPKVEAPKVEAPAGPPPARLTLTGDARMVRLVSGSKKLDPTGPIPEGTYDIQAWFGDPEPAAAGKITLAAGEQASLKCVAAAARCIKQ